MTGAEDVKIQESVGGSSFLVRAQPRARRAGIAGVWRDCLRVAVAEPAEDGRANDAILYILAELLGLRKSTLAIRAGAAARAKVVFAEGLRAGDLRERIRAALARGGAP